MQFSFTRLEQRDLAKSWILVSLAFAIFMVAMRGSFAQLGISLSFAERFLFAFATAAVTVGIGFLAHELAHKWVANRHDCHAEYRADTMMLLLSVLLSPLIFLAAPGAVHISGHASHEAQGRISVAGPAANLLLALLFFLLFILIPNQLLAQAAGLGAIINSSLAIFNLIPLGMFDGAKVISWDRTAYATIMALAVILTFVAYYFVQPQLGLF